MPIDTKAPLADIVEEFRGKNADEMLKQLEEVPFFMTDLKEGYEDNPQVEALRALAYEGEPWEIAENFKQQGNDCFKARKFKDAVKFYSQALDQQCSQQELNIACLGNRAQCNLELKNFRRCITDCTRILDLDINNVKAWFRSAKAFLLLDKPDESVVCCERGLKLGDNESLTSLKAQATQRMKKLAELAAAEQERKERLLTQQRTLELAQSVRNFKTKFSVTNKNSSNHGNLIMHLENPLDANSTMFLPVLVLYPTAMESDILEEVDEAVTVNDILEQLFVELPKWADPSKFSADKTDVFVQTESGGLAKAGKKTALRAVFGSPAIIMVDNMARMFVVPKSETASWLKEWNKEAQAKLLRD